MGDIPEQEAAMAVPEPPSSTLALRVFYLRVSRCEVDESMLGTLTLTHTPLTPDTILDVSKPGIISNGNGNGKGGVSFALRRDRVDRRSEEATFVCTATVRVSGSVRFEVQSKDERIVVGILEVCDDVDGGTTCKSWAMKCQAATQRGSGFLRCGCGGGGGGAGERDMKPPVVEVCVAGLSSRGTPVVFTRAMHLRFRPPRRQVKAFMDPIPECGELVEDMKETPPKHHAEESESYYRCYKPDPDDEDDDDGSHYTRSDDGVDDGEEYSELSWFTAGVRVGVGISLGICLGVGIGAGLLARSYQSTSRTLKRRLISNLL